MIETFRSKLWQPLMDAERNPLRNIPAMQRYQLMIMLAMMWSFIFCAMLGWWMLFPYWSVGHIALLSTGAFLTNYTFKINNTITHRDRYRSADNSHALHDDIWGG